MTIPEPPSSPLQRGVVVPASHVDRSRLIEDLSLLADAGADFVRIGLDWPWMQPSAGGLDGDAVEFYLGAAQHARALGIDLWLTLTDRDVPHWFDDEGGFGDERFALHWWPRWVEHC
ncbi:MAG TPA: family 1 glycosylhydrolase, partial [Ilumatobacteraceae bacterium]|nr:family 1 glycosylhydrolase [Ilumatobacteraceae bacterium]